MKDRLFKKGWCFAMIFLFVGASVVPSVMSGNELKTPTVATMSTTWYVKEGGNNSNGGTGWNDAWRDINYAAINYSSVVDGDTIMVGDGTYDENVVIGKQLTIEGNGSNVATIDGGGVGNVIGIHASEVTITGFTITNSGPLNGAGIYVYYGDNIYIKKNLVENNHRGIWFYYGRLSEVKENVVQDNSWGIYIDNTRDITIYGNWVLNNTGGIIFEDVPRGTGTIEFNVIKDNPGWGGVLLYDSWANAVKRNNFINNGEGGYTHIISSNCRNKFSNNYYEPTHWTNLGFFLRIYVVWGLRHWPQIQDIFIPMIAGIDTNKAEEQNPIPPPLN